MSISVIRYENKLNDKQKYFSSILFVVMLMLDSMIGSDVYSWVLVLLAAVLMLCYPSEYLLVFCVLTDSIQSYFLVTQSLSFSRILMLMYIMSVILQKKGKLSLPKKAMLFILFAMYHLMSSLWSITGNFTESISFCIGIAVVLIMMGQSIKNEVSFYRLLIFTAYWLIAWIFFQTIIAGGISSSQVIFDDSLNANTICSAVALFGVVIYCEVLGNNRYSNKLLNYLFITLSVITILLIGSRTALIAFLGVILVLPIINGNVSMRSLLNKPGLFVGVLFLLLVLLCTLHFIFKNNSEIFERFTFLGDSVISIARRVYVWEALWNHIIPQNFLLGIGYGIDNVRVAVAPYVVHVFHAHNMFLGILSETGIIGLIQYIVIFFVTLKHIKKNPSYGATIALGMILTGFFLGIGEEVINRKWFWLAIGFAYLLTNDNCIKENGELKNK